MNERDEIAREYLDQLVTEQLRSMYRHVYGAGFFWGFMSALTGAVVFYFL